MEIWAEQLNKQDFQLKNIQSFKNILNSVSLLLAEEQYMDRVLKSPTEKKMKIGKAINWLVVQPSSIKHRLMIRLWINFLAWSIQEIIGRLHIAKSIMTHENLVSFNPLKPTFLLLQWIWWHRTFGWWWSINRRKNLEKKKKKEQERKRGGHWGQPASQSRN